MVLIIEHYIDHMEFNFNSWWPFNTKPHPLREQANISFFKKKFIYLWLLWVFGAARRLSLAAASGGYSSLRCVGFSLRWLLLLWSMSSRSAGFSSCASRAQ